MSLVMAAGVNSGNLRSRLSAVTLSININVAQIPFFPVQFRFQLTINELKEKNSRPRRALFRVHHVYILLLLDMIPWSWILDIDLQLGLVNIIKINGFRY